MKAVPAPRSIYRVKSQWDDLAPVTASSVYVPDQPDMEDTGLLDAEGRRLYREREPIGFKIR